METNDISNRPAKRQVTIGDGPTYAYGSQAPAVTSTATRRAIILRAPPTSTTIWPGDFVEINLPDEALPDCEYTLEPRSDAPSLRKLTASQLWPPPSIVSSIAGKIRIPNLSSEPHSLKGNEHFCQVNPVFSPAINGATSSTPSCNPCSRPSGPTGDLPHNSSLRLDPENALRPDIRAKFQELHDDYDEVFDPRIKGYNGAAGSFEAQVNMGPVEPPQRKGRLPQYARNKLVELQEKFDQLEELGVFKRPEDIGISIEYLNPSFLVKKQSGGYRLVTRNSMKYCGVATPFKGVRVYVRSAMGMPGSETALEELYVTRGNKLHLAGFFSAKLRGSQVSWLPCEIEALSIATATKHFSPYIIQSNNNACILTDSKPCVQAFEKLCRGEFSTSPRVSTFLSVVSRFQASVGHVSGAAILPSDFTSCNTPPCQDVTCQVCAFIHRTQESVVRQTSIQDILHGHARLPFTTRASWLAIQSECKDLRRTHAHLVQGTRPSKKLTNIRDVKRYLNVATIAKDGLLVVKRDEPFTRSRECIIVPRQVLDGLLTALHIQLSHLSSHQLKMVTKRYLFALDMDKAIKRVVRSCTSCAALSHTPQARIAQSSCEPPDAVGISFATDVLKRSRQLILVLRESVTSYTSTMVIEDERHHTLRDALVRLCIQLRPLEELYVTRGNKLHLAGFFSAKLRGSQVSWLPCEIEALSIATATKHFSPYIIQSNNNACILTDSKPCVQAFEKLCRGEFSTSPRVSTFLSVVSLFQASVRHVSGAAILPSDFTSCNTPPCQDVTCQVCAFIHRTQESVVRQTSIQDILHGHARLPFTTRASWLAIQSECKDLRRTHAHLVQGTRPSKKLTNIRDVKRYLNVATIAKDGLLVVKRDEPFTRSRECIIVPRQVLDGLLTALHIQLSHPSSHQLKMVTKRYLFALDMDKAIKRVVRSCTSCAALSHTPQARIAQSSCEPPDAVGISFATDVLKRSRQLILVLRESVTSYTSTMVVEDERHHTLRDALVRLCIQLRPLDGPPAVIRTDPAPGFKSLVNDQLLQQHRIVLELGNSKNANKNPVAEKAVQELEIELLRQDPLPILSEELPNLLINEHLLMNCQWLIGLIFIAWTL